MKAAGKFPLGRSEKFNVAVQRPSVNVREAENLGEQAAAAAHSEPANANVYTGISKHGTFSPTPKEHLIEGMWND
jgi:hypothetical protein